ncbi:hypothetical protein LWI29_014518 [Acer saccharum]|uniref:Uncharacterized protein n=1 Tax=Acer saccharum TaxID=4024 RepID=A0AA39TEI8_ACESA|nr:hypothetical protein LWI29_014518 [Acer saccharum]
MTCPSSHDDIDDKYFNPFDDIDDMYFNFNFNSMMMELITSVAYSFRNMVLLIVNYDGQWEDGQFNPKAVFFLSMTVKETLKTLAEKICSRFGLNSDEVDFKISTRIDGSIVEMIYDLDLQIFIPHNKENPKCYVSVFHKQLQSQACTPPPMMNYKSTLSPVVSSSGYRSTTGSNEFVLSGFPVDESKTPPSIRKSIFPQSPLATAGKKSTNHSNHGDYAKNEKVHCPTVVTVEDEEDGMGCSANINSPLCPCSNEISPQDLPLRLTHDDNPLHLVDLISLSALGKIEEFIEEGMTNFEQLGWLSDHATMEIGTVEEPEDEVINMLVRASSESHMEEESEEGF